MATYRYPCVTWTVSEGPVTAFLLRAEGPVVACGRTEREALRQVRERVVWEDRRGRWLAPPTVRDAQVLEVKVEVRPEYRTGDRSSPCAERVVVVVPCLEGEEEGRRVGVLPTLGVAFVHHGDQDLRELAAHMARQALQGLTPQGLSRYVGVEGVRLHDVAVTVQKGRSWRGCAPALRTLRVVAEALTERATRAQFVRPWGREALVRGLTERLVEEDASLVLVGERGAGKTTVLVEAARRAEQVARERALEDAPRVPTFWQTSGARVIAGMKYLGEWEERLEVALEELSEAEGVLCVQDLLELVRTGGRAVEGGVGAFLVPSLEAGELRLVAEVTPEGWEACQRLLPGLAGRLQVVRVPTFDREETRGLLRQIVDTQRRQGGATVGRGVVDVVERVFARFRPYEVPPGPAARFVRGLLETAEVEGRAEVGVEEALEGFLRETRLPARLVRDDVTWSREALIGELEEEVVGQREACALAAEVVLAFKAGLNDPQRPLGVLLFSGPTGVGKTALARALARLCVGHGEGEDRLIRVDMSEYGGPGAAERLLGGEGEEVAEWLRRLRRDPCSVVLFDEVEKAAPEVFDALLGAFDEGRLTDRYGRVTWLRSALVILTSNLGAGSGQGLGFGEAAGVGVDDAVRAFFRPELYNRLDAVVPFSALGAGVVRQIAARELEALGRREGLVRAGLTLRWDEAVVERLATVGFDPRFGARPLQRAVERWVVRPLARLLACQPELQDRTLRLELEGGQVVMKTLGGLARRSTLGDP